MENKIRPKKGQRKPANPIKCQKRDFLFLETSRFMSMPVPGWGIGSDVDKFAPNNTTIDEFFVEEFTSEEFGVQGLLGLQEGEKGKIAGGVEELGSEDGDEEDVYISDVLVCQPCDEDEEVEVVLKGRQTAGATTNLGMVMVIAKKTMTRTMNLGMVMVMVVTMMMMKMSLGMKRSLSTVLAQYGIHARKKGVNIRQRGEPTSRDTLLIFTILA
jgi:hypothetical protein